MKCIETAAGTNTFTQKKNYRGSLPEGVGNSAQKKCFVVYGVLEGVIGITNLLIVLLICSFPRWLIISRLTVVRVGIKYANLC